MRSAKKHSLRVLTGLLLCCLLFVSGCQSAAKSTSASGAEIQESSIPEDQEAAESVADSSGSVPDPEEFIPWHSDLNYEDMVYERPDLDAIYSDLDAALALVSTGSDEVTAVQDRGTDKAESEITYDEETAASLLQLYDSILTEISYLDTMDTLASIENSIDLDNSFYEEEVNLLDAEYNKIDNRMNELTEAILDSVYAQDFVWYVGEDFIERYEIYSGLNSPEIEELSEREIELVTEYRKRLNAEYTTIYNGVEISLDDLDYSDSDSLVPYYEIYARKNAACGEIYLELVQVRTEIAQVLGYDSYTDYAYELLDRDFTKEDAAGFSEMVREYLVPVADELYYQYYFEAYIAGMRTDVSVEDGLPYLRSALEAEFPAAMTEALDYMLDHNLYIFDDDESMMTAGFTTLLTDYAAPFLFINTSVYTDPGTLFHEFGHYYNFYLMGQAGWNDSNNLDLAEVHSQALELLMLDYYPDIYGSDAEGMQMGVIMSLLDSILLGCCEDEFQQKVYENPDMTLEEMNELHNELYMEYMGCSCYYEWTDIHHHFETPFYYISYATSAASAFEIWELATEDRESGLAAYRRITQYTLNSGYLEPLEESGLSNPFTSDMIKELAETLTEMYLQ